MKILNIILKRKIDPDNVEGTVEININGTNQTIEIDNDSVLEVLEANMDTFEKLMANFVKSFLNENPEILFVKDNKLKLDWNNANKDNQEKS